MQRYSQQRERIYQMVCETRDHPTAQMVYDALHAEMPRLSLGTVYRNLSILRQDGDIQSVGHAGGMEHFDGEMHPHAHFFCGTCGCVTDLMDVPLPPAPRGAPDQIRAVALTFHGTCRHCLAKEETDKI